MTAWVSVAPSTFVGRVRELEFLRARLTRACAGIGSLVLLSGEPGIGKTRTLQELAREAAESGALVLWGRCHEGGWAPPYAPWAEAIAGFVRAVAPDQLVHDLGACTGVIAQVVPAVRSAVPNIPPAAALSPREERFRFFEAIAAFMRSAAERQPLLLVLDDVHWIERPALELLQSVVAMLHHSRVLIAAAYRDGETDALRPLSAALPDLFHDANNEATALKGLNLSEAGDYVTALVESGISPELVQAVHTETSGNPFFMGELLRHLLEERGPDWWRAPHLAGLPLTAAGIPSGVRHVVSMRLGRLRPVTQQTLHYAATFSGDFEFEVLRQLLNLPELTLLDSIDEALAAQLIKPSGARPDSYEFLHAIVRRTVYDSLSPSRRMRMHRQVAATLERVSAHALEQRAAELAAQYHASIGLPGAERGYPHAVAAAEQARAGYAHARAARFLSIARDLAGAGAEPVPFEVLRLLAIAQADALLVDEAETTVEAALARAGVEQIEPAMIAAFVAAVVGSLKDAGARRAVWQPLINRGLALLGESVTAAWAGLILLDDPIEPVANGSIEAGRWVAFPEEAIVAARASGDEDDFARTLRQWDWRSRTETEELRALTNGWRRPGAILRAKSKLTASLLYRHGAFTDAAEASRDLLAAAERFGSVLRQAEALVWLAMSLCALGDFGAAQESSASARNLLPRLGPSHHLQAQEPELRFALAYWLNDDWCERSQFWASYASVPPPGLNWFGLPAAAMASLALVRQGASAEAARLLAALTPAMEAIDPRTWLLNSAVCYAAEAVWELGTGRSPPSERILSEAHRYKRLALTLLDAGISDYPGASNDLAIARMASLTGAAAEAETHFVRAQRSAAINGQRPIQAMIDLDRARSSALQRTHHPSALCLLDQAECAFRALGSVVWGRRARSIREILEEHAAGRMRTTSVLPGGLSHREAEVLCLLRSGRANSQIAAELVLSVRTVERHIANIYSKIGVRDRRDAAEYARNHGVGDPA